MEKENIGFQFRSGGGVLPSARRPVHVEEEKKAEEEVKKFSSLKIRLNRGQLFKDSMVEWYNGLSHRRKENLTSFELKRRALFKCEEIYGNCEFYTSLPKNWVTLLREEHGMVLKDEVKRAKKIKKMLEEEEKKKIELSDEEIARSFIERRKSDRLTSKTYSFSSGSQQQKKVKMEEEELAKTQNKNRVEGVKEFVDLTKVPPPQDWVQAYIDTGKVAPRELKIYSAPDKNILFYDYGTLGDPANPSAKPQFIQLAHKGDGFNFKF